MAVNNLKSLNVINAPCVGMNRSLAKERSFPPHAFNRKRPKSDTALVQSAVRSTKPF